MILIRILSADHAFNFAAGPLDEFTILLYCTFNSDARGRLRQLFDSGSRRRGRHHCTMEPTFISSYFQGKVFFDVTSDLDHFFWRTIQKMI